MFPVFLLVIFVTFENIQFVNGDIKNLMDYIALHYMRDNPCDIIRDVYADYPAEMNDFRSIQNYCRQSPQEESRGCIFFMYQTCKNPKKPLTVNQIYIVLDQVYRTMPYGPITTEVVTKQLAKIGSNFNDPTNMREHAELACNHWTLVADECYDIDKENEHWQRVVSVCEELVNRPKRWMVNEKPL